MSEYDGSIAKTDEQVALLLSERPNCWEYLLYAGAMCAGVERLENKYSDYSLGYAPRLGIMIKSDELLHFAKSQLGELQVMIGTLNKIFDPEVMEDVLGAPGVSGEPDKILHGASRLVRLYEDMLLWAERIRGMAMPDDYREAVELLAQMAGQPIGEIRDFVHRFGEQVGDLPARLARGERVEITETVKFTLSSALTERFNIALKEAVLKR